MREMILGLSIAILGIAIGHGVGWVRGFHAGIADTLREFGSQPSPDTTKE